VPLAGYFGFTSQWQNAGTLESNTIEASLQANLIRTRDASFDIGLLFDRTDQEITALQTNAFRGGPRSFFYFRQGEILGALYGDRWMTGPDDLAEGLTAAANQFQVNDEGYLVPVGDASFRDGLSGQLWGTTVVINDLAFAWGIPILVQDEEGGGSLFTRIADALPDFTVGLPVRFRYKGFRTGLLLNAQIGGDVYNFKNQGSYRDGRSSDQDQTGKEDGLKKPTEYYETLYDANEANSHFVEDGTFVKLREFMLSYTFDRDRLTKVFGSALHRLTVGVVGRNLLTFSGYSGLDPEVGTVFDRTGSVGEDASLYRLDNFAYPNYRTYSVKLELQF
jgi:hypothetical protein